MTPTHPDAAIPRPVIRPAEQLDHAAAAARDGHDLYEEFAAYRELAEARRMVRSPEHISRRQMAGAIRVLRSSDDAGDRWVADNLASAMGMSAREIERSAAPRPALILWLLAMVMLALPGWIWLGVTLFGRWAGP